jgi:hypothetical protein
MASLLLQGPLRHMKITSALLFITAEGRSVQIDYRLPVMGVALAIAAPHRWRKG